MSQIEYKPRYSAMADVATAETTTLRVRDHQWFETGDVIHAPETGENMLVKGTSPGEVRVVRGVGTEPHRLLPGDELLIIGSALTAS